MVVIFGLNANTLHNRVKGQYHPHSQRSVNYKYKRGKFCNKKFDVVSRCFKHLKTLLLDAQSEQKRSHDKTNSLTSKIESKVMFFGHKNSLSPDYAH